MVSNHTILGLEFPLLLEGLYKRKGIFLRALADHSHFEIPVNANIMRNIVGAFDGTPRNADLVLELQVSTSSLPVLLWGVVLIDLSVFVTARERPPDLAVPALTVGYYTGGV